MNSWSEEFTEVADAAKDALAKGQPVVQVDPKVLLEILQAFESFEADSYGDAL